MHSEWLMGEDLGTEPDRCYCPDCYYMGEDDKYHLNDQPATPEIHDEPDSLICGHCGGSGQGAHESIRCFFCKGMGEVPNPKYVSA